MSFLNDINKIEDKENEIKNDIFEIKNKVLFYLVYFVWVISGVYTSAVNVALPFVITQKQSSTDIILIG